MSKGLEIEDGDPGWVSTDIWVVPGSNPNGPPGQPVEGEPAYLWARVHNKGEQDLSDAQVNYYWSTAASVVLRSKATKVGNASVNLRPGETKEVLCVVPWTPVIVDHDHQCIVVEVIHPADPLPFILPDVFGPIHFRQVAQRNLGVLAMKKHTVRIMPIQVAAPMRRGSQLLITTEFGGTLDEQLLVQAGLGGYQPLQVGDLKVGLSLEPGYAIEDEAQLERAINVSLKPGTARAVYLHVGPIEPEPQTYVLLHVISQSEERVEGGITYIVVTGEET